MDELTDIDLSSWRVRELPAHFADDVIARLDALDDRLADELEVIDDELELSLHVLDDELESVRVRQSPRMPPRPSGTPWMLGIVLAAAAAALVWMWPEPPAPQLLTPQLEAIEVTAPMIAAAPQPADLDRGAIRRAVGEQFVPKARDCYNQLLIREPAAAGRVTLRFDVVRDGDRGVVDGCTVDEGASEIADTRFHGCLVDAMKQVIFDAPTGDGRVSIVYPVVFRPSGTMSGDESGVVIDL